MSTSKSVLQTVAPSTSTPSSLRPPTSDGKHWVEPSLLPTWGDASSIGGNAPLEHKQLMLNTFKGYGMGDLDNFGHNVGNGVRFTRVDISGVSEPSSTDAAAGSKPRKTQRTEATVEAEVTVSRGMLNGAGMLHGGCVAWLVDNIGSTPLAILGLAQGINGVGVTQSMNVLFHSPAPPGMRLRIQCTSVSFGRRIMSSRCEMTDVATGRMVASASLNKMQPMARL